MRTRTHPVLSWRGVETYMFSRDKKPWTGTTVEKIFRDGSGNGVSVGRRRFEGVSDGRGRTKGRTSDPGKIRERCALKYLKTRSCTCDVQRLGTER